MSCLMLQQAVGRFLASRGWEVASEGRILSGRRDNGEIVLGFLEPGDARGFLERWEDSTASLGAVLLAPFAASDVGELEGAGIRCFSREEIEDAVLADWLRREARGKSRFVEFLDGA